MQATISFSVSHPVFNLSDMHAVVGAEEEASSRVNVRARDNPNKSKRGEMWSIDSLIQFMNRLVKEKPTTDVLEGARD